MKLSSGLEEYIQAVNLQKPILKTLSDKFFSNLPQGITHSDFAADNILFNGDDVSAIIDFDTNRYGYVWRDIGRALISFTLNKNTISKNKIISFIEGYSQHMPLDFSDALNSLRLTWCLEVTWWIQLHCFQEKHDIHCLMHQTIL